MPAAPINDLEQLFSDPHLAARKMVIDFDGVPGVRTPLRFSKSTLSLNKGAPKLGNNNHEE